MEKYYGMAAPRINVAHNRVEYAHAFSRMWVGCTDLCLCHREPS
jgi:hypothetical protein